MTLCVCVCIENFNGVKSLKFFLLQQLILKS